MVLLSLDGATGRGCAPDFVSYDALYDKKMAAKVRWRKGILSARKERDSDWG